MQVYIVYSTADWLTEIPTEWMTTGFLTDWNSICLVIKLGLIFLDFQYPWWFWLWDLISNWIVMKSSRLLLLIRPEARKAYGSIAHETLEALIALEGEGSNCCSITQLVGQKQQLIIKLANASWRKIYLGIKQKHFATRWLLLIVL